MRTKKYLILDTETCTLPFVNEWGLSSEDKKKIAISKPLVYDIGWTIADRTHGTTMKRNFLVAETFAVPSVFNTGYYHEKRPLYLDMMSRGEITILPWNDIMTILIEDMQECAYVCAYNAMFDFKKAINFTDLYISKLYSPDYYSWEGIQRESCRRILSTKKKQNDRLFDPEHFIFRGEKYPIIDIWGIACLYLLNNSAYKRTCLEQDRVTSSGLYFTTNAEVAMQYLSKRFDFIEDHTALSDAEIETEILFAALKRGKIVQGIIYFPYKMLGETVEFVTTGRGVTENMAEAVADKIREYLGEDEPSTPYQKQMRNKLAALEDFIMVKWGE